LAARRYILGERVVGCHEAANIAESAAVGPSAWGPTKICRIFVGSALSAGGTVIGEDTVDERRLVGIKNGAAVSDSAARYANDSLRLPYCACGVVSDKRTAPSHH
jgi:hypothetical protein